MTGYEIVLPHFLLTSFLLFALLCVVMIVISLLTKHSDEEEELCSLKEAHAALDKKGSRKIWIGWIILAVIMLSIYLLFNLMPYFIGN